MSELFYSFFNFINSYLGAGGLFIISLTLILLFFAIRFFCIKRAEEYPIKKRLIYLIEVFGVCTLELAFLILCKQDLAFSLATFSIGIFLFVPILSAKKKIKNREKERKFIKYIDDCLLNKNSLVKDFFEKDEQEKLNRVENFKQNIAEEKQIISEEKVENAKPKKAQSYPYSLDFSHVKSVIARLENLSLGASDKRQIRELESVMAQVERGAFTPEIKEKVNDGLGALLKIMARYGA